MSHLSNFITHRSSDLLPFFVDEYIALGELQCKFQRVSFDPTLTGSVILDPSPAGRVYRTTYVLSPRPHKPDASFNEGNFGPKLAQKFV